MINYKFLKQKAFEKLERFEKRLHETANQGWKIKSFTSDHGSIIVMLERER
ncbi:hypothetical protein SAMN05421640_2545 [Ekhidna lutea]|uniref:DUF4177 domain-containing protein n=1 Tax=Ekhidna lutea TaxID=447679 RepID=A0A239KCH2_EKHLU|nr:hypothetical protein [Ekhidna lutea]SNT15392.1 hypothetical protein SAMN05421640_2545 [Ekhidna lutea]